MTFWIAVGLIALVVALLMMSVLRRRVIAAAGRSEYDLNVYKDQLKELEREAAEGRIAESELAAARLEIERRLLAAAETSDAPATKGGRWPLIAVSVAAPVAAVVMYLSLGTPGMPDFPLAERTDRNVDVAGEGRQAMETMVDTLAQRLQQQPDDAQGWVLLGRSYVALDQLDKAVDAFDRAVPLTGRAPAILADWAEVKLMRSDGKFSEEIFNAFIEARQKDPTLPKPWFYIGLDRAQGGRLREAAQYWVDMIAISPPDASYIPAVREKIAQAAEDGKFDAAEIKPSETAEAIAAGMARAEAQPATPPAAAPMPGPTREEMEAAGQMSDEDRQAFIRSMVDRLASRLEENPNDPAGWERLIRAYEVLGETENADAARARLKAIQGN